MDTSSSAVSSRNRSSSTTTAITEDPRWRTLCARKCDSSFFYAVITTGVYCRPGCASRLPRPENVRFYGTRAEAEHAGFRPCRRCRPEGDLQTAVWDELVRLCRLLEDPDAGPDVQALAAACDTTHRRFLQQFKQLTGCTPRQYARARREALLREHLAQTDQVTDSIFSAGFSSTSRFYERGEQILGMKPTNYRAKGQHENLRFAVGQSSLGAILVASSSRGICHLALGDDPQQLLEEFQRRFAAAELLGADAAFERLVAQVVAVIEQPAQADVQAQALPLDIRGTVFQVRVWQALQKVPPGTTLSYAELARRVGAPKAVRAVAGACAANTLAVLIPCHRIVRTDGGLSGYRWGIERKRQLLEREGSSV